tara:strand:- start:212 stop:433 length:222 start_codon:yes stop_codon:yes gene_type:complete
MNYKIVNNNTGATYFLNEKEKINFFIKNKVQNYNEINLTKARAKRRNKMLDVVAHLAILGASILATLIYIQNY